MTATTGKGSTGLADHLILKYEDWRTERKDLQLRWEDSRENFQGTFKENDVWKRNEGKDWRDRTHVNMTKDKVMFGYAVAIDQALQNGKIPFDLSPSPFDRLTLEDMDEPTKKTATDTIADMESIIDQQLFDANADQALMKNTMCMAQYGETYAKKIKIKVVRKGYRAELPAGFTDASNMPRELISWVPFRKTIRQMGWAYRPIWNIFRDLETEDLHAGQGVFDRDFASAWDLRQKKGRLWIKPAIDLAISEQGTSGQGDKIGEEEISSLPPTLRDIKKRKKTIRVLEFWGRAPKKDVEEFEAILKNLKDSKDPAATMPPNVGSVPDDPKNAGDDIEIMAIVAGQHIVFFTRSKPEDRPFERAVWDEDLDELGGKGVADNVKHAQKMLNGGVRAFNDNKKLSGNVILAIQRRFFSKIPKFLTPGAIFEVAASAKSVRDGFESVQIQDVGESLLSVIALAERFGDIDSMIPKIQQGITEKGDETAFEVGQRLEKASKYMAQVMKNLDEGLIEPMIQAFYDDNMDNPDIEKGKGNFIVKAMGFKRFQDRVATIIKLQQWMALLMSDPAFRQEFDIVKVGTDIGQALDIDTNTYRKTEERKQAEAQQLQQAAQLNAQLEMAKAEASIAKDQSAAALNEAKAAAAISDAQDKKAKTVKEIEDGDEDKGNQGKKGKGGDDNQ